MHALGFHRRPPRWGAFHKLLVALDPAAFEEAVARWAEATAGGLPPDRHGDRGLDPAALDGKAVRGAIGRHQRAVHLLSVMGQRSGLTLRQAEVGDQTNEHKKAALELLRGLAFEGRAVTGDAMFCRRDLCRQILADGGPYFVAVKENQPELLRDIRDAFTRAADAGFPPPPAGSDRATVHRASQLGQAWRPGRVLEAGRHRPVE